MLNSWSHWKFLNLWTLHMKSYAINFNHVPEHEFKLLNILHHEML